MIATRTRTPAPPQPQATAEATRAVFGSWVDLVNVAVVALTAGLMILVAVGVQGVGRVLAALVFVSFVPGWVVLSYTRPPDKPSSRVALAVTLSLGLSTLASVTALWLNLWNPRVLLDAVGTACLVGLLRLLAYPAGPLPAASKGSSRLDMPLAVRRAHLGLFDLLLPAAMVLWLVGVRGAQPDKMNDYGLLPGLPFVYFAAVGLLIASIVVVLLRVELSPSRLGLHLVALIVVFHSSIPLIFRVPIYPWLYKHVGVIGYINLHGSVSTEVDIYQNWPGFFSLAAWFTRIAGVGNPVQIAAWAPVYFNLLICLQLGFIFRALPLTQRVRWTGMFLFVAGNWVGQDYFAPQSMAFLLSLGVFGIVLTWLQADRPSLLTRATRRIAFRLARPRADPDNSPPARSPAQKPATRRVALLSGVVAVFGAVVITHPLSPYLVLFGLGLLAAAGLVRPRWLVAALTAVALAYLVLRLPYINRTQDLFASLGDPFHNLNSTPPDNSMPMVGRRFSALAAPALILTLWALATLGVARQTRAGRPTMVLALLAVSPTLLAFAQSYGGEAVFRIYLFSLPWVAALAATAIAPRRPGIRPWPALITGGVLTATVTMFMFAFYGAAELYVVQPGEVQASQYFYDHAQPGGVLKLVTPNFPGRVSGRYNQYGSSGDNPPELLNIVKDLRHRTLGRNDLPAIAEFVQQQPDGTGNYLVLSHGQQVHAEVLGLLPVGSLTSLDQALAQSPDWQTFYTNPDATIYQLGPRTEQQPTQPSSETPPLQRSQDQPLSAPALGIGLFGLVALGLVLLRRRRSRPAEIATANLEAPESGQLAGSLGLTNPNPAIRAEAVEALAVAGNRQALNQIMAAADDPHAEVRAAAYRRLADAPQWVLWIALGRCSHRSELIGAISGTAGTDRIVGLILERFSSPDHSDRLLALRLTGHLAVPALQAEAVQALTDPEAAIRRTAARNLKGVEVAVPALVKVLHDDPATTVRREAAQALTDAATTEAVLLGFVDALEDPDTDIRRLAADTLVRHPSAAVAQRLTTGLTEANLEPYSEVLLSMGFVGEQALTTEVERGTAGAVAAHLLKGTGIAARLQTDLKAVDPPVRLRAVKMLGAIGGSEAQNGLIAALSDPRPEIRTEAARSLGRTSGEHHQAIQRAADFDQAPEVQLAAAEALLAIDQRAQATNGSGGNR